MDEQNTAPVLKCDDFFLLNFWRIVAVRKWLVLLFPVLTVLAAFLYLVMTKPIFECSASMLAGQVGKSNLVRSPAVIVQHVSEKYRVRDRTVKRVYPRVVAVDFDKKDSSNVVVVKVADFTPEGAKAYLMEVFEDVLVEQKQLLEENLQIKNEYLQALTAQIADYRDYEAQLDKHIDQTGRKDPAQAAVLALERGKFLGAMPDLAAQHYELRTSMSDLESYPAHLLWEPQLPEKPVRPRRVLILLLALISGVVFGITAASAAEMIKLGRAENLPAKGKS